MSVQKIQVIDSHTGGEPTRVIIDGGPDLGNGSLPERVRIFRERFDELRRAVINEPRGSDILVGALLCPPVDSKCVSGVIFFNNAGYLNMCGHGAIGVAVTLAHLGRVHESRHYLETPVGIVEIDYLSRNQVAIRNVPSYRLAANVCVEVDGFGEIAGDVAWGGNWFYLVNEHGQDLQMSRVDDLLHFTRKIRQALEKNNITGADGAEIDHLELIGPPSDPKNDGKSFVLCPGLAYDRSPCGTGTSAKVACLAADGKLKPGETWRQESIVGSVFEGSYELIDGKIIPTIKGSAYVTGETTLLLQDDDPFRNGISPA